MAEHIDNEFVNCKINETIKGALKELNIDVSLTFY